MGGHFKDFGFQPVGFIGEFMLLASFFEGSGKFLIAETLDLGAVMGPVGLMKDTEGADAVVPEGGGGFLFKFGGVPEVMKGFLEKAAFLMDLSQFLVGADEHFANPEGIGEGAGSLKGCAGLVVRAHFGEVLTPFQMGLGKPGLEAKIFKCFEEILKEALGGIHTFFFGGNISEAPKAETEVVRFVEGAAFLKECFEAGTGLHEMTFAKEGNGEIDARPEGIAGAHACFMEAEGELVTGPALGEVLEFHVEGTEIIIKSGNFTFDIFAPGNGEGLPVGAEGETGVAQGAEAVALELEGLKV